MLFSNLHLPDMKASTARRNRTRPAGVHDILKLSKAGVAEKITTELAWQTLLRAQHPPQRRCRPSRLLLVSFAFASRSCSQGPQPRDSLFWRTIVGYAAQETPPAAPIDAEREWKKGAPKKRSTTTHGGVPETPAVQPHTQFRRKYSHIFQTHVR